MTDKAAGERTAGAELDLKAAAAAHIQAMRHNDVMEILVDNLIAEVERLRAALRSQPEGKDQTDVE